MRISNRITFRRAFRKAVLYLILPAAVILAFRLYWGWHAQRRFDDSLARVRALHIRTTAEEFPDDSQIPAESNAVRVLFARPPGLHYTTSAESRLINDPLEYQSPQDQDAILRILALDHDFVERIDTAGRCPQILWPRDIFGPGRKFQASGMTEFGRLLVKSARIAHLQNQDTLALEDLNRLMTLAHIFERSPILIDYLVALNMRYCAADGVEQFHAGLALQNPDTAAQARKLIAALLDDGNAQAGLAVGIEAEIVFRNQSSHDLPKDLNWIIRPFGIDTLSRDLDQLTPMTLACRAENWKQFVPLAARIPGAPSHQTQVEQLLYATRINLANRFEEALRLLVANRAAALLLAAQLYAAQNGNLPATPADLAALLPAGFPVDPFADGKQPLHYRLDANGPTIWSVSKDGIDNHADLTKDLVHGSANPVAVPPRPATRSTTRAASTRPATTPASTTKK